MANVFLNNVLLIDESECWYNGQMDVHNFNKWVWEKLALNLPPSSVAVKTGHNITPCKWINFSLNIITNQIWLSGFKLKTRQE